MSFKMLNFETFKIKHKGDEKNLQIHQGEREI
jgi:hypothetical protein